MARRVMMRGRSSVAAAAPVAEEEERVARLRPVSKRSTQSGHCDARLGYKTVVTPRLEFPLSITEFTQRQCDKILSPILAAVLPKMGYNRHMPREVVFGPAEMGGLGVNDLFIQQGIHAVQMMVGHLRDASSRNASLIRIALQWCQLQEHTGN